MDKETKAEFEKVYKIHDGLREGMESLTEFVNDFKNETTGKLSDLENSQQSLRDSKDTSKPGEEETGKLHDEALERVAVLEERNTFLEGPGYQNQVIQGFLRELDADNFLAIGVKLGYLEDTEASPEDLENVEGAEAIDVPLGDNRTLKVSKEKPEDMTGWEYSETQGLYIKLE